MLIRLSKGLTDGVVVEMVQNEKADHISKCLELAILLEASAHKPGNVSVVTDFDHTRYEHFLTSAVAARPSFERAARQGIAVSEGKIVVSNVGVGRLIMECASDIDTWEHGGNTLLGTIILLVPIAASAGMTLADNLFEVKELRKSLSLVIESTTPEDAVNVYNAIGIARPSGLGSAPRLDVNDPESVTRILRERTSLYQIFKIAEKYDTICSEWTNNYPVTFDLAYPCLTELLGKANDLNLAIIQTFLKVLAECPDTFIARKTSLERAQQVSVEAKRILSLGGLQTSRGKEGLRSFDQQLRKSDSLLNPGTTADIISAALALCILDGYRP
jgi:triphosphoribosyl-dephospho-CoA synthase